MEKENINSNEMNKIKNDITRRYLFSCTGFVAALTIAVISQTQPNYGDGFDSYSLYMSFIFLIISIIASLGPNYVLYGKFLITYRHIPTLVNEKNKSEIYLYNENNTVYLNTSHPHVKDKIEKLITSRLSPEETNLINLIDGCTNRFTSEIQILNRKGQINLWIGIITTIIGASILSYHLITTTNSNQDHVAYLIQFLIRISIVIFFEFFAFFFLRLYKNTQEDIKFYQNEISNIELKTFAAMTALANNDTSLLKPIIEQLAATERNFILKKGETTIGLEREKLDKNEIIDLVRETIISTQRKNK